jgi:enamine deaminase RidA (YjgF/YER057c/UK114 family)
MIFAQPLKIHYIEALQSLSPIEQLENCLDQLSEKISGSRIIRLTIFLDADDNAFFNQQHDLLNKRICQLPYFIPVSIVAQKPMGRKNFAIEAHCLENNQNVEICHKEINNIHYLLLIYKQSKLIIVSGLHHLMDEPDILIQSKIAFEKMEKVLKNEEMDFSDVVRQWNYIDTITDYSGENQHYQIFNDVRSLYYSQDLFENGYPSATGIGAKTGGVCIDFIAVKGKTTVIPVKNPVQVDAHAYAESVLENNTLVGNVKKSTPKFERAKILDFQTYALTYISGTAAIKGEKTIEHNATDQTLITIQNIDTLLKAANKALLKAELCYPTSRMLGYRVYVKNEEDLLSVKEVCQKHLPSVPSVFLQCNICRNNLLVEIEALLINQ